MKNITIDFSDWTDEDINLSVANIYYDNELMNRNDIEEIIQDEENIQFISELSLFENVVSSFDSDDLKIEYDRNREKFKVTFEPFVSMHENLARAVMQCYLSLHLNDLYLF